VVGCDSFNAASRKTTQYQRSGSSEARLVVNDRSAGSAGSASTGEIAIVSISVPVPSSVADS
jgi:hypothetical protein